MIRHACTLLALAALPTTALAGTGPAQEPVGAVAPAAESVEGVIQRVDSKRGSFVLAVGERTQTVEVTDSTRYTLDGKATTRDLVLKVGARVTVTHTKGVASSVAAITKK